MNLTKGFHFQISLPPKSTQPGCFSLSLSLQSSSCLQSGASEKADDSSLALLHLPHFFPQCPCVFNGSFSHLLTDAQKDSDLGPLSFSLTLLQSLTCGWWFTKASEYRVRPLIITYILMIPKSLWLRLSSLVPNAILNCILKSLICMFHKHFT